MVIKFEALPDHMKLQCLNKLDFKDFTTFSQTSHFAFDFAKVLKKELPLKRDNWKIGKPEDVKSLGYLLEDPISIHFNKITFKARLTDDIYMAMLPLFKKGWTAEKIKVWKKVLCRPILFNKIVQFSRATSLYASCQVEIPADMLRQPAVYKLLDIHVTSPINDDDVIKLQSPRLMVRYCHVTAKGINAVLKQWLSGKRSIEEWNLVANFPEELDFHLFPGIPILDLLNPEIFYEIKGDHFPRAGIFLLHTHRSYGITKGEEHLLIEISLGRVWIRPINNFDQYLGSDQIKPIHSL